MFEIYVKEFECFEYDKHVKEFECFEYGKHAHLDKRYTLICHYLTEIVYLIFLSLGEILDMI